MTITNSEARVSTDEKERERAAPQDFPVLRVNSVTKSFNGQLAVDKVSFDVRAGELFTLLGPSGCGKTTTLRQIAGLEQPDGGEIWYRGEIVAEPGRHISVPPEKRQMGMVFQSYAIWPHLSVFENIAYPLRVRKARRSEISERVDKVLELVGMSSFRKRSASALSGGQQQRVALARALVYEPDLLLLDEPFSNLDAKLREQMGLELKLIQQRLGVAAVMVTHDQSEALALSDRIAVLDHGRLQQIASPEEIYDRPATTFVRDFVGNTITVPAVVRKITPAGTVVVIEEWGDAELLSTGRHATQVEAGGIVQVAVRPESIAVIDSGMLEGAGDTMPAGNTMSAKVEALLFQGQRFAAQARVGDRLLGVYLPRTRRWTVGDAVSLRVPAEAVGIWAH